MVEVEIMSMLISSLASVSNMVAAMPGCDFMPTPMSETRATSASAVTPEAPSSSAWACDVSTDDGQVGLGHGEGDVGRPVGRGVLHDHVDVDRLVGQGPEEPGRDAGAVRAPR